MFNFCYLSCFSKYSCTNFVYYTDIIYISYQLLERSREYTEMFLIVKQVFEFHYFFLSIALRCSEETSLK